MKKIVLLVAFLMATAYQAAARVKCEDPLEQVVMEADIIAAADIARLAPPPGMWSGYIMSL
jgi:hypothetical protein